MKRRHKAAIWIGIAAAVSIAIVLGIERARAGRVTIISGAVLTDDPDPRNQRPIGNAEVVIGDGPTAIRALSEASGLFRIALQPAAYAGDPLKISLRHPDYAPFEITKPASNEVHVIRMKRTRRSPDGKDPEMTVSGIRVRYALKSPTTVNVGSVVKTLEVLHTGNRPCENKPPCSPDGRWKAVMGSASIDAGAGNQFRSARVSCIAGPCPFTKIESERLSRDNRVFQVTVRNWSDTATFLLEAEVVRVMVSDSIRHAYPMIFGDSMNWTLPATAQGPTIETEIDGSQIVFPLGPNLKLSWANCSMKVGNDETKLYRCDLKPGYRFQ
jgi:hypothetical protein